MTGTAVPERGQGQGQEPVRTSAPGGAPAAVPVLLIRTAAELRSADLRSGGVRPAERRFGAGPDKRVRAVVMTMGALHEGHAALVRAARARVGPDGEVLVTVFVNPLQFGPGEDLERYPRTLDADLRVAAEAGADAVFAPTAGEMYPDGQARVRVSAGPMGERLEGASRPGHFDGMLTVVAKLLHLTAPDVALYGQKDAQQLALVRRMVRDLDMPVEIAAVPTVREPDGLALSSRNRYLSPAERETALALSRALNAAGATRADGGTPAQAVAAARAVLDEAAHRTPPLEPDYLALVDPVAFTELDPYRYAGSGPGSGSHSGAAGGGEVLLAVAARVGSTRLIDNAVLPLVPPGASS